jgi:hypothetical protein
MHSVHTACTASVTPSASPGRVRAVGTAPAADAASLASVRSGAIRATDAAR